jgi:2-methylisocitrate lyase-like PEP mutase family enzyme
MTDLQRRCDLLRSLHRPGNPLLLPNAWDVATARAVVAAGFPAVATTSDGVAAALGYEDREGAPADVLAAAARIARASAGLPRQLCLAGGLYVPSAQS